MIRTTFLYLFFFSFFLFLSFKSSDHNNLLHLSSRGCPRSTLRILVVFFSYYTGGNYVKKALNNHFKKGLDKIGFRSINIKLSQNKEKSNKSIDTHAEEKTQII